MPIKLIVSDMDETLLNDRSEITQRTKNALERAMSRGARVALASGRMVRAMLPFARALRVNAPIIALNGAATYDIARGKYVSRFTLSADLAKAACELARREGMYIQAFCDGAYFFEEVNERNQHYAKAVGVSGEAVGRPLEHSIDRDIEKLLVIDEPEKISRMQPIFAELFKGRMNCFISRPFYLELTAPEASKANALTALANCFGIAPGEIVAFGDAQNDLSMLAYAGYGYAVSNARAEVLKAVCLRAPSNVEDGVAKVVEQMLSENEIAGDARPDERIGGDET